jgi:hypothetical protein
MFGVPLIWLLVNAGEAMAVGWLEIRQPLIYFATMVVVCILIASVAYLSRVRTHVRFAWWMSIAQFCGFFVLLVALIAPIVNWNLGNYSYKRENITGNTAILERLPTQVDAQQGVLWYMHYSWSSDVYMYSRVGFHMSEVGVLDELGLPLRCMQTPYQVEYLGSNFFDSFWYVMNTLTDLKLQPIRFAINALLFFLVPLALIRALKNIRKHSELLCESCGYMVQNLSRCPECAREQPKRKLNTEGQNSDVVVPKVLRPRTEWFALLCTIGLPVLWFIFLESNKTATSRYSSLEQPAKLLATLVFAPLFVALVFLIVKRRSIAVLISISSYIAICSIASLLIAVASPVMLTSAAIADAKSIEIVDDVELYIMHDVIENGIRHRPEEYLGLSTWAMDDYVVARKLKNPKLPLYYTGWEEYGLPFRSISAPLYYRDPRPNRTEYLMTLGKTLLHSQIQPVFLALNAIVFAICAYLLGLVRRKYQQKRINGK